MKENNSATIFLDIDGVICVYPGSHHDYRINPNHNVSAFACKNLKAILDATGAKIVISSSWRLFPEYLSDLVKQLKKHGINRDLIVGITDNLSSTPGVKNHHHLRWLEISDYIEKHNITKYVIIDDFNLDEYTDKNFIKTQMHIGLTEELRDTVIRLLS
jgi:hypothetical protein